MSLARISYSGKVILISLCLLCVLSLPAGANEPIAWQTISPGLEFATLDAAKSARSGSSTVAILRVDPARNSFRVLSADKDNERAPASAWRERTGALAVFNAGQYTPEELPLGLLVKDGKTIGRMVSHLDGLFVAQPKHDSLTPARVIDLRYTTFDPAESPYLQAAQSLMLLDRFGHIRVRKSTRVAHRTALAIDQAGRILIIITEGGHTLWEFADFLKNSRLKLREVMNLDGGPESQLDIKAGEFTYSQAGEPMQPSDLAMPWPVANLPIALAVFPAE